MVIIVTKRVYIIVFSVLCVSIMLLSLSFAKESGPNNVNTLFQHSTDNYRVIYGDGDLINTYDSKVSDISLINKSNAKKVYALNIVSKDNKEYPNILYSLNGSKDSKLGDGVILLGSLEAFGTDGDHATYSLELKSQNKEDANFNISIKEISTKSLYYLVKYNKQVYLDNYGDYRFYGENVNNYVRYNNILYRIVGVIDGKIKLVSDNATYEAYDASKGDILTVVDYLYSFNNKNVKVNNVTQYNSWLTTTSYYVKNHVSGKVYTISPYVGFNEINDNTIAYSRNVIYLDGDLNISLGNGSLNNPYEVPYGS